MAVNQPLRFPLDSSKLRNSSPQHLLEIMHRKLGTDLRADFNARVEKIRAKGKAGVLGPVGVQQELRALRQEYEAKITTESWNGGHDWNDWLGRARARANELQTKLTARPEGTPDHLRMRRELQANRTLREYLKLEPAARRAAVADAREKLAKGDSMARLFLSDLLQEPAALDQQMASRVESDLMSQSDPAAFRELEEFLGPVVNGQRDETLGALHVTEYAVKMFRDFMAEQTGTSSATEAARALLEKQLSRPGPALELSESDAKDPAIYRLARDTAKEHGRVQTVSGPKGEGSIDPNANGGQYNGE